MAPGATLDVYENPETPNGELAQIAAMVQADRDQLQARTALLQERLRELLERADRKSPRTKYHRAFARNLLGVSPVRRSVVSLGCFLKN